jgi:hypothetical protein
MLLAGCSSGFLFWRSCVRGLLIFIGCGRAFGYSPATCLGEVRGRFKYQPPHLSKWRYFRDAVASRYGRALPACSPPCSYLQILSIPALFSGFRRRRPVSGASGSAVLVGAWAGEPRPPESVSTHIAKPKASPPASGGHGLGFGVEGVPRGRGAGRACESSGAGRWGAQGGTPAIGCFIDLRAFMASFAV